MKYTDVSPANRFFSSRRNEKQLWTGFQTLIWGNRGDIDSYQMVYSGNQIEINKYHLIIF